MPDLQANVESTIAEGDEVATRVTMSDTHRGKLFGFEPTGDRVAWPLVVFSRFVEDRIAEDWVLVDTARLEAQLEN